MIYNKAQLISDFRPQDFDVLEILPVSCESFVNILCTASDSNRRIIRYIYGLVMAYGYVSKTLKVKRNKK